MKISVIVCTHNRCERLSKTLSSLADLTLPEAVEWEVLVVDNNSTDRTSEVVQRDFCDRIGKRFRYIFEPRPGKSYALNAGIRQSQGEILAFTDDDVIVEKTWLHNLASALHSGDWAGAGGRVVAEWASPPPRWLALEGPYALGNTLALFDQGSEPHELSMNPFGANMAFRRAMFGKYGGFRTDLGPRAGSREPQKSEDAEFGRRLLDGGERLRYEPSAVVRHWVPESRLQKKYFLTWWFDKGRSDVRKSRTYTNTKTTFMTLTRLLLQLSSSTLRWTVAIQPQRRFYNKVQVYELAGQFVETYSQAVTGNQGSYGKPESMPSR